MHLPCQFEEMFWEWVPCVPGTSRVVYRDWLLMEANARLLQLKDLPFAPGLVLASFFYVSRLSVGHCPQLVLDFVKFECFSYQSPLRMINFWVLSRVVILVSVTVCKWCSDSSAFASYLSWFELFPTVHWVTNVSLLQINVFDIPHN